jgi:hypothetical protein
MSLDNEEISAAQPMNWSNPFANTSPEGSRQDRRDDDEESKHSRSPSPSPSLSSMED